MIRIFESLSLVSLDAPDGAALTIRNLNAQAVKDLIARNGGCQFAQRASRVQDRIAESIHVPSHTELIREGETVLIAEMVDWRTIRWFSVTYDHDADGVVQRYEDPLEV
jgi:uncharacterized membrane protein